MMSDKDCIFEAALPHLWAKRNSRLVKFFKGAEQVDALSRSVLNSFHSEHSSSSLQWWDMIRYNNGAIVLCSNEKNQVFVQWNEPANQSVSNTKLVMVCELSTALTFGSIDVEGNCIVVCVGDSLGSVKIVELNSSLAKTAVSTLISSSEQQRSVQFVLKQCSHLENAFGKTIDKNYWIVLDGGIILLAGTKEGQSHPAPSTSSQQQQQQQQSVVHAACRRTKQQEHLTATLRTFPSVRTSRLNGSLAAC
mmetsp:Transcript_5613/g.9224  ORF Transcript_5613/g.9224 Transcript_5613/m.9224 type:complete len:250 (+) Transcript_5613:50-799(+)